MAPLRTYSRKSSTSNISAMTAFDILLAKNLTQRKLIKKKTQKKKYQVKELPKKIKSILCDESLHININDTFDKVLKAPLVNGNSKDSRGDTQGNSCKSWFAQTTLPGEAITNSLEIEGKNGNLKESGTMSKNHSRRNSSMLLRSQVYKQSSKNSLQISVVDKNIPKVDHINCSFSLINVPNKSKLKKSLQDRIFVHSSTPITVKCNKHFEVQQLSPIGLVDEVKDPVSDCIIESLKEIESWNLSGNSSMPKCPKYAESFVIEASSILEEQNSSKESKALTRSQKLKQLMRDAEENHISDMQKRITRSSSSQATCAPRSNLPEFSQNEVPHKLPIISITQCNFEEFYNKCVTTEINSEPKIKVVTQEDFETFCKQHSDFNSKSLRINSQSNSINPANASNLFSSDLILSRSLNDFEKFEEQFYQSYKGKLSTSKSITKSSFLANIQKFNFITHRKHKFSTMGNKSILLKPLTVILDDNIINLSNKLIKTPHVTKSSNGKQLTVCLTRLSLQKLKSRDFSHRDSIFGANRTIIKACRKFSSNSLTPSFTFQPSSRGAQGSSRQSEFLSIGRAGKQLSNITNQGEVALICSRDLMQSRKSINAEKENRISGFSSKQQTNQTITGAMQMIPAKMLRKPSFYLNKTRSRSEGYLPSDKKSTLQDLHKQRSQSSLRSKKESEFGRTPRSQTSKKEYVAKIMSLTPDRSRESWANSLTPSVRKRKDYIAQDLSRSFLVNPSPIVKSRTSTKSNRTSRIIESQSRFTQSSSARSSHITYVDLTVDLDTEEAVQTSTPRRSNEHQICTRSSSNISLKSRTDDHSYLSHSSLEKSHLSVDLEELAVSERHSLEKSGRSRRSYHNCNSHSSCTEDDSFEQSGATNRSLRSRNTHINFDFEDGAFEQSGSINRHYQTNSLSRSANNFEQSGSTNRPNYTRNSCSGIEDYTFGQSSRISIPRYHTRSSLPSIKDYFFDESGFTNRPSLTYNSSSHIEDDVFEQSDSARPNSLSQTEDYASKQSGSTNRPYHTGKRLSRIEIHSIEQTCSANNTYNSLSGTEGDLLDHSGSTNKPSHSRNSLSQTEDDVIEQSGSTNRPYHTRNSLSRIEDCSIEQSSTTNRPYHTHNSLSCTENDVFEQSGSTNKPSYSRNSCSHMEDDVFEQSLSRKTRYHIRDLVIDKAWRRSVVRRREDCQSATPSLKTDDATVTPAAEASGRGSPGATSSNKDCDDLVFKFDYSNSTKKVPIRSSVKLTPVLLAGKSWRRSLMQQRRDSVLDLTSSFCRPTGIISTLERATPRMSAVIVPSNDISRLRRKSKLQSYAESAYTVIDLTKDLESPVFENAASAKEIVMNYCKQTEPIAFTTLFPSGSLSNCKKIGEGVYGEVFMYSNAKGRSTVMKIIPIEGDVKVNGEMQKKFHEILPEVTIVSRLSNLRTGKQNKTSAFCELQRICCVKGKYPDTLLRLWHAYDSAKGSENDSPDVFESDQLYIVLELADAGQDLEAFVFNNAQQALSIFKQVAYGLAIAEEELQFEHRDLHWGNILVKKVNRHSNISFKLKGKSQRVQTNGVEATIIDFTLSRMSPDMVTIFTDLGADPELFEAKGDYQFDIYRLMKERNNNDWEKFTPHSNILWLHYVLVKSITALRYKNTKTKVHKKYVDALIEYRDTILKFDSVSEFVDCL